MVNVKLIVLGTLKEAYLRDAAAEYEKRLGAFCKFELIQLKEERISDSPSENEIKNVLDKESEKILELEYILSEKQCAEQAGKDGLGKFYYKKLGEHSRLNYLCP